MPAGMDVDIYQRFELEVRTPKRRLLVDAFLPSPDSLPSVVTPATPPPMPLFETGELGALARLDNDVEPEPKPKPRKRVVAKKKKEAETSERSLSLQEEIAEFIGQRGTALVDEEFTAKPAKAKRAATAPDASAEPDAAADPDAEPFSKPDSPAPPVVPDEDSGSDPKD